MSSRAAGSLSRKRMEQLVRAVGSRSDDNAAQLEFTEYDWHDPHYFSGEQLVKLDDFARAAAQAMGERFSDFCRTRFDVIVSSITQHFAGEYFNDLAGDRRKDCLAVFGAAPDDPCGWIALPEQTANEWARRLLGDSDTEEDSSRTLSSLEESLLLDLVSALIEALSTSSATRDFRLAGGLVRGRPPLDLPDTEELCKISFDVKKTDSENSSPASLVMRCSELASVAGKILPPVDEFSDQDISGAILDHLREMTVTVTAQLDSTALTFEEVMSLQVNDLLLLDKTLEEPIELIVDGRRLFSGRPAKSVGKYAVVISAVSDSDTA